MKIFLRYFQIHGFVGTEPGDMDENRVLALFHACPSTLQSSFRYFHTLNYALKLVFLVLVFDVLPCLGTASNATEVPDDFPVDPFEGNGGFQGFGVRIRVEWCDV